MTACLFALCASVALAGPPPLLAARAPSVVMGGMEQKLTPLASGNRVSLQLSGPTASLEPLAQSCVGMARSAGLTGIVYSLERLARLEIVAEGGREHLDALVDHAAAAADVECKVEWQAPVGGYDEAFPLVTLRPQMSAVLGVHGDKRTLDYYTRHLQVEAVFNRGLKLASERKDPTLLSLRLSGDSARLKSFVRWAQRGPPLERAERVVVTWS
mmetsp:Transcript_13249/g.40008  ORF Transcript_13249/g.40008 Transcript_13249/m.40008 type:complete len:214 (+) Transcript_13249:3-644(+)